MLSHTCPQVIQRVALRKLISDDTGVCACESVKRVRSVGCRVYARGGNYATSNKLIVV